MKTTLKIWILPALLLAFASAAHAASVTIGSYGTGDSNMGNNNSALDYVGYSNSGTPGTFNVSFPFSHASYDVSPNSAWASALSDTSWVSNVPDGNSNGNNQDRGYYEFTSTFTATSGTYNGSFTIAADDTAEVYLDYGTPDQHLITGFGSGTDGDCFSSGVTCGADTTFTLTDISLLGGTNTLTIIDEQGPDESNTPLGVDFKLNWSSGTRWIWEFEFCYKRLTGSCV